MTTAAPHQTILVVSTRGRGLVDVTDLVRDVVRASGVRVGLCSLFLQHTSASLVVQENADPSVLRDLERFIDRLAPEDGRYEHDAEGPDDMPAHIKASLLGTSVTIPVRNGRVHLGTWQGIYLCEHRDHGGPRTLTLTLNGE